MVSEKQKLKEQILEVREILAIAKKQQELGYNQILDCMEDVSVSSHNQYLTDQRPEQIKEHLERLEEDYMDLKKIDGATSDFTSFQEYYKRREKEEDDD